MINDVINTFFEEKVGKSLEVKKKVVPLHPQSRNKPRTSKCPDGGIGRRAGLKHQWIHFHPGSTPGLGTKEERISRRHKHTSCPDGGIGRRAGLKHQWIHFHPGSTPGLGTKGESFDFLLFLFLKTR